MKKWIYKFGLKETDGNGKMQNILGGKGAALAEMSLLGIPVPPGFTISTQYCREYNEMSSQLYSTFSHKRLCNDENEFSDKNKLVIKNSNVQPTSINVNASSLSSTLSLDLMKEVTDAVKSLEQSLNKEFSIDAINPLLVSVRSGSPVSMPGMMDTILNLGLTDKNVENLAIKSGNPKFAYDSYRRFIQMYSIIVLGLDNNLFEDLLDYQKRLKNVKYESELTLFDLQEIIYAYQDILLKHHQRIPQDPYEQLWQAVTAVLNSWQNPRAIKYRELNQIPSDIGTAVNIQSMVFGNMGEGSATGVIFTRNPSNGENDVFGEFLLNAQGEDVVDGSRNTYPITEKLRKEQYADQSMEEIMPSVFRELIKICHSLELHYRNMQDIEFTVENGKVWILQTRNGKRSVNAGLRIAKDMVHEGLISRLEAIQSIEASSLDKLLHCTVSNDHYSHSHIIGIGLPASPGAAYGTVTLTASDAERISVSEPVILMRTETSPDDIFGMNAAQGIVTARGGMTSHAAVVARGMGKPCICSVSDMKINLQTKTVTIGHFQLKEGDKITIDGSTGRIILGQVSLLEPQISDDFSVIMNWSDDISTMKVRANAETISDAKTALKLGAIGIGLCRTEHMFFSPQRILTMRKMILALSSASKQNAIQELEDYQREDFIELFDVMKNLPVAIRLLDPPLHEFLPKRDDEFVELVEEMGCSEKDIREKVEHMSEENPMLGHRGCRLAITHPEIYKMQARAIFDAVLTIKYKNGLVIEPEIMLPLVVDPKEIILLRKVIEQAKTEVEKKWNKEISIKTLESVHISEPITISYKLGTMIELPRAALQADLISPLVDFCSFGTNDLTQTTMGLSRDDSTTFMYSYIHYGIFKLDPFISLDIEGVGELIKIAVQKSKTANPNIKLGVCGEHGGDPASIKFFADLGIDYVSCSPYRVPIARLASAQSKNAIA